MLTEIQNGNLKTNDESLSSQPILKEGPQAYYSNIYIYIYIFFFFFFFF